MGLQFEFKEDGALIMATTSDRFECNWSRVDEEKVTFHMKDPKGLDDEVHDKSVSISIEEEILTLMQMDKTYVESGGSFRAVVVSLLSSESFRYRKDLSGAEELLPFP